MLVIRLFPVLFLSFLFSATASAQVFDSGPSDSALFTNVINLPPDDEPEGIVGGVMGETTQLNVTTGGVLTSIPLFQIQPFSGFFANEGAEVNIDGGSVGNNFQANQGSEVNIRSGTVGNTFQAFQGSEVSLSGGSVGFGFRALVGSAVNLIGGEYKLNGAAYTDATITLGVNDVFTGTLADGSAFIFSGEASDILSSANLVAPSQPLPNASLVPIVISTPVSSGPQGLRAGQSLTLLPGGQLRKNFAVVDAALDIAGGAVESDLEVAGSVVNISGGSAGTGFQAHSGSEVNISGGSVGDSLSARSGSVVNVSGGSVENSFVAWEGSEVNISGGSVDRFFTAWDGSTVNISGGTVGPLAKAFDSSVVNISGGTLGGNFDARSGSVINISGGSIGDVFEAFDGSTVNLSGSAFVLDGAPMDNLVEGAAFTIVDRDVTLSGVLADGTAFSFDLNSDVDRGVFIDQFEPGATLTVTLTSEVLLGDCNLDGVVNFLDIAPFIELLRAGDYLAQADMDEDGVVTFSDIIPFVVLLSS